MNLIQCPEETATYGLDIPFTVLEGATYIEKNLERDRLVNVQLPQKFKTKELLNAHNIARLNGETFTEDASLYFHFYHSDIRILPGSEYNIKVTKPIDRTIAEIIYKEYILGGTEHV